VSKDFYYTTRWFAKEISEADSIQRTKFLSAELEKFATDQIEGKVEEERETPEPDEVFKPLLVLIVGHTKIAPGASLATGGNEYDYNSAVARIAQSYASEENKINVEIVFRDGIGIDGAYNQAEILGPDACVELHFNAFNKKVKGTETLSTQDGVDIVFAEAMHSMMCEVFERKGVSRDVKILPRSARGGRNIYSLPGYANCLVEPFFGDNEEEAKLALKKQAVYAKGLVNAATEHFKSTGLLGG
jgi:N-acetylmuramoyl-L-alanine amidase